MASLYFWTIASFATASLALIYPGDAGTGFIVLGVIVFFIAYSMHD